MRRIVCAALRHEDGSIVCGPRHYDATMRNQIRKSDLVGWPQAEQGFIDQNGKFLTRTDAWDVAVEANQIISSRNMKDGILYSEHLY